MSGEELIKLAEAAALNAYSPYSNFKVGAALLDDNGNVYTGCNVENSSFSVTCCAERVALLKAVSEGSRKFKAIAVVGTNDGKFDKMCTPCGVCRQALLEFVDVKGFKVYMRNKENVCAYTLSTLLPFGFKL